MSGTSLDGIDAVIARLCGDRISVLGVGRAAYDTTVRSRCLALCRPGSDEIETAAALAIDLAALHVQAVESALRAAGVAARDVIAAGVHGQTVRHRPSAGFTIQLVDAPRIATALGIDVVCDFRSADMALGGEGAPLVPAFHRAAFGRDDRDVAVLNLGGIANLSLLGADGTTRGFDVGPANVLMDAWHARHRDGPIDHGGRWADSGRVLRELLERCLSDPWFERPPPKSTGRELFDLGWLEARLDGTEAPADVQATLAELTAVSVTNALAAWAPDTRTLYVCGGGAANGGLMRRLAAARGALSVESTSALEIPPDQVEATAFAWLARCRLSGIPANATTVTGARRPAVLGAWHHGRPPHR
jgi:anhydro-N-acetylmuramic acid kinase